MSHSTRLYRMIRYRFGARPLYRSLCQCRGRHPSTMGRFCLIIPVAIAFAVLYMALHVHMPSGGSDKISAPAFKTNAVIGQKQADYTSNSRTIANGDGLHKSDSAYPYEGADDGNKNDNDEDENLKEEEEEEEKNLGSNGRIKTYFSAMSASFSDVPIGPNGLVATQPFLAACLSTTQLFEKMHKTILDQVVRDIRGNVEKLQRNYDLQPAGSETLQGMVLRELELGLPEDELDGTSMLALTWLKRAFAFISRFLSYIDAGQEQTECARKAYEETLRQYHGFVLRTVFKAAFHTLSSRSAFLQDLALNESDIDRPDFEEIAMNDLRKYNSALTRRLEILEDFFNRHDLVN